MGRPLLIPPMGSLLAALIDTHVLDLRAGVVIMGEVIKGRGIWAVVVIAQGFLLEVGGPRREVLSQRIHKYVKRRKVLGANSAHARVWPLGRKLSSPRRSGSRLSKAIG